MKTSIIFNLDSDLVEKLQMMENRSSFLNELLHNHFKTHEVKKVKVEEMKQELKELETEVEREERKRKEIAEQEEKIKASGLTQEAINYFHANKNQFVRSKLNNFKLKFGKEITSTDYFKLEREALQFKPIFENK